MKLEMKKFSLVLLILLGIIFLTGCNIIVTAPNCCQLPTCSVTVVSVSPDVYGEIVINGKGTGKYFLPYQDYQSIKIDGIPCNTMIEVFIKDYCGYISDKIYIYTSYYGGNYVTFYDWGPYGVRNESEKKENCDEDCHK